MRSKVLDVKGVCDSAFTGPNSAIISDSCDYIGTYLGILSECCLPCVFKYDLVSLFVCVPYLIIVFLFVTFID